MDTLLFVVVLITLTSQALAAKCTGPTYEPHVNLDHLCIEADDLPGNNRTAEPSDIILIRLANSTEGVVEVTFPLSKNDTYHIYLWVIEGDMEDKLCENNDTRMRNKLFKRHSVQDFDRFKCKPELYDCNPTCGRRGRVKIPYIFTGCYYVKMEAVYYVGERRRVANPVLTKPRMIRTSYKKEPLWSVETIADAHCNLDRNNSWEVNIAYRSRIISERIPLRLWLRRNYCAFFPSDEHIAAWAVDFKDDDSLKCYPTADEKNVPKNCTWIDNETFKCTFSNIPPGNYCVTFEPDDNIRCTFDNLVWTVKEKRMVSCNVAHRFTCNETVKQESVTAQHIDRSQDGIYIAVGVVLLVCFVAAIVYLIAQRKFKHRRPALNLIPVPTAMQTSSSRQVLLLYAQDCGPFMELMVTFRQLLANVGQCEVLDCFDHALAEDIAQSPVEWMCRWASSPEVKVVVVASNSAFAHQKAMSRSITLQYKEPLPNSHLFLYGLREVTHNHKREYTNTFVVRFDDRDLGYLNPYTRYVLPLHLLELLKNLNPSLDVSNLGESKDEQKLRDLHSDLMQFKRQNPDYLVQLMVKSGDVECA